jgi:hypothetical protein
MPDVVRELLWALLWAALSLPVAYLVTTIVMAWVNWGYVKVDPLRLRRIAVSISMLVFVVTFLIQKFRG